MTCYYLEFAREFYLASSMLSFVSFVILRYHRCRNVSIIGSHRGLANDFTSYLACYFHILFVLPSWKKYFSKVDCGEFSVWKHLLEDIIRVLLLVSKVPRTYYSVLKSVSYFLPEQVAYCSQNEEYLLIFGSFITLHFGELCHFYFWTGKN